jgi:hypothetical protein
MRVGAPVCGRHPAMMVWMTPTLRHLNLYRTIERITSAILKGGRARLPARTAMFNWIALLMHLHLNARG